MDESLDLSAIGDAAAMGLAALLVFGMARLGTMQYRLVAPGDAEAVPLLHVFGLATGIVVGIALLLSVPHAAAFSPLRLFAGNSPWEMTLGSFLKHYALPQPATLQAVLEALGGSGKRAAIAAVWLAVLGLLAGSVLACRLWHGIDRLRAIGAFLLLAVWTALILHYAAHFAAWGMAQLHVWLFAAALVLLQRWRYRGATASH
jgi:hypothetical protein